MLPLDVRDGGVVLPIQAKPKASRNALAGVQAGRLKVAVTAAPEKGRANAAVLAVLADALRLKPSQLSLVVGETDPRKTALVTGIAADDLRHGLPARFKSDAEGNATRGRRVGLRHLPLLFRAAYTAASSLVLPASRPRRIA